MLEKKTVFILGAGASCDYGLPTGEQLLGIIRQECDRIRRGEHRRIANSGFSVQSVTGLGELIKQTTFRSIDAMLAVNSDHTEIGKFMIASCLLPYEKAERLFDIENRHRDWMLYLFEQMRAQTLQDFLRNPVTFITFNYDRCLEWGLRTFLMQQYRLSDADGDDAMKKIRIIHVHGQLGSLSDMKFGSFSFDNGAGHVTGVARGIKIIHEADRRSDELDHAAGRIVDAERVGFLGFGFHESNIERLQLPICKLVSKRICGTAHGLTEPEINQARGRMKAGPHATFYVENCIHLLRNSNLLF